MKTLYPKSTGAVFKLCIVLLIACVAVIYGCRKDISKLGDNPTAAITDPKIAKAKSWYETNYSQPGGKSTTQNTNAVGNDFDLSQFFKPNWAAAKNYTRFNDDVIEMPMDAASSIGLKVGSVSQNNSRSSVLILKRGDTYKAYVMTIVGYPEYLNGDTSKLANNSYGKHDADFSGILYYSTPQGEFVSGCIYKQGAITGSISHSAPSTGSGTQVIQSNKQKVNTAQVCVSWYYTSQYTMANGQLSPPELHYGGEDCYDVTPIDLGSPTLPSTPPGNSGGGGGGNTPTNPDPGPCTVVNPSSIKDGKVINTLKVMLLNPGDGGFPPPGGGGTPCPADDPCDKVKKQKQNLPADFLTSAQAIVRIPNPHEFGSDLNLASLASLTLYKPPYITTNGTTGKWDSNFKWNSTDGYTIGSMHRHQAAGPSPDDIFGMIDDRKMLYQIGASAADKQFYEDNAYAVILLNNTTIIITINPGWWGTVQTMFNDYDRNRIGYRNDFQATASQYQTANNVDELTATLAVLKQMFGDGITLSKAAAGSTRFVVVTGIDQDGKLITKLCPQ